MEIRLLQSEPKADLTSPAAFRLVGQWIGFPVPFLRSIGGNIQSEAKLPGYPSDGSDPALELFKRVNVGVVEETGDLMTFCYQPPDHSRGTDAAADMQDYLHGLVTRIA